MSNWVALNVEPEDDSQSEVDDTKEIQLEEAFKLYQNALKLHSQGPAHYKEADEAYNLLFQSDVFKYPEATSEYEHDQLDEDLHVLAASIDNTALPIVTTGPAESANSFPQLVYLAYKARAQFLVDYSSICQDKSSLNDRKALFDHYAVSCSKSLSDSAAALERDDTDLDLWKRAARVADTLLTSRTARFCLESVLAGDDEGEEVIDLSGLDEAFAKYELQDVLQQLQDNLSQSRISKTQPKSALVNLLRQSNDPYPFLPRSHELSYINDIKRPLFLATEDVHSPCSANTYEGLTSALRETLAVYGNGVHNHSASSRIVLDLPQPESRNENPKDVSAKGEDSSHENQESAVYMSKLHSEAEQDSPASFHSAGSEIIQITEPPQHSPMPEVSEHAEEVVQPSTETTGEASAMLESVRLPSRKRSSTAAGNDEPEARSKSKRIKARESLAGPSVVEDEVQHDPSFMYRDQLAAIEVADEDSFKAVNAILDKIGITNLGNIDVLRQLLDETEAISMPQQSTSEDARLQPFRDLKFALRTWDDKTYNAFMLGNGARDHMEGSTGLSLFLKHSKKPGKDTTSLLTEDGHRIRRFVRMINAKSVGIYEATYLWLVELLTSPKLRGTSSPYLQGLWSSELKQAVLYIITTYNDDLTRLFLQSTPYATNFMDTQSLSINPLAEQQTLEFAQAMFELHLDVYSEMLSPGSTIEMQVKKGQLARLQLWAQTAADLTQRVDTRHQSLSANTTTVVVRFLWASVMFAKTAGDVDKTHALLCLRDLQSVLENFKVEEIVLPNSTVMSFISEVALEQEISKVETLEFFMSVFDSDNSDPYSVIMKLEPILEYTEQPDAQSPVLSDVAREQIENFRAFLDAGDASLTLFLWKRLQNAYTALSYNTKVVSCMLRSIEIVTSEIFTMRSAEADTAERQLLVLRWIRDADELLAKVLTKILDDKLAFESIDESHLRSSMSAVISLLRLVHIFVLVDDGLRVGSATPPPHKNATAHKHFEKCRDKFRETYVRLWTLLYLMIREAAVQIPGAFQNADDDLILFLRTVHAALGGRQYCRQCNKLFVRITKGELFSMKTEHDLSLDIAQIIYDLYQIKLFTGQGDVDHGCSIEPLDRDKRTAHDLVPIIMDYVKRLNVKDLLRSELKTTIDKIQGALGQARPSTALVFNRKAVSAYLKSLINPQRLFQSLRGVGEMEYKKVSGDFERLASQGWYLALGNMTLAKYRSVKRVNPTPTDELDNAQSYLRQDLEHNPMEAWESWYRLAQVYDAKIEDCLIWNSNKLNEGRSDLCTLERNAINAYTMAMAIVMRAPDEDNFNVTMLNDMCFEFATRLYSSSRPPLTMEAFNTEKTVRHLSNYSSQVMSIESLIRPMSQYMVWTLAAHLIRKSLSGENKTWTRYYMLGKCLWKMFNSDDKDRPRSQRPVEVEEVIDAFSEAVERVPKKEKSSDPILEPHYKLTSIVHKLQNGKKISPEVALEYLQVTAYAKQVHLGEDDKGRAEWEAYILTILGKLKKADKSGWHHRITARAAHVIWDNEQSVGAALGAKHEFADSIFTKNMTMQVWKPEHERPGRHYVYTGRYLDFFINILVVLKDRSNLEQVVRKIRRKTTDFINHTKVWEDAVTKYIDLLRELGNVPPGRDRALFDNITFDEFTRQSEKLEKWAHEPATTSMQVDLLQDAIEMKKLNNSLSKSSVIDDLIGDIYAGLYETFVSELPPEEQAPPVNVTLPQGTFINMNVTETVPTGDDNRDRMRLNNLLSSQTDGAGADMIARPAGLGIITNVLQGTGTPPPDPLRVPAPSKPGRAKTITRREVQKKAEALISKPPPIKTPTLSKKPLLVNIPGLRKSESQDRNDKEDGSVRGKANMASTTTSRRGSVSRRNSMDSTREDGEDDGGDDGDNEEEDEEEEDDDNDGSDSDGGTHDITRKRLFPGLLSAAKRADDDNEDDQEEEENEDQDEEEEGTNLNDDTMSDVQVEDGSTLEIPDSQEQGQKMERD